MSGFLTSPSLCTYCSLCLEYPPPASSLPLALLYHIHIHYSGYSGKLATFPKWVLGSSSLSCITWYLSPFIGTICSQVPISIKPKAGKTEPPSCLSSSCSRDSMLPIVGRPQMPTQNKDHKRNKHTNGLCSTLHVVDLKSLLLNNLFQQEIFFSLTKYYHALCAPFSTKISPQSLTLGKA